MIGEIGINHNGDLNIAKELISNAKKCNFDAVKFQKRDIYKVYSNMCYIFYIVWLHIHIILF